ncbi:hypothetical protein G3T36_17265 [Diaminobutyricibacter tongyongensis]|uniref:Uncharacterized protein n=1 Tax=Leifsonia tongyongensis TaxID=1268043 RepID=A0A6L9Y1P0_9MICO|nr:hypothetical protein [Diaminobutyricibacter tongyongensis]NEN07609.1 hypothetical protein [Diaminobutyricibacter tongyongensis]
MNDTNSTDSTNQGIGASTDIPWANYGDDHVAGVLRNARKVIAAEMQEHELDSADILARLGDVTLTEFLRILYYFGLSAGELLDEPGLGEVIESLKAAGVDFSFEMSNGKSGWEVIDGATR